MKSNVNGNFADGGVGGVNNNSNAFATELAQAQSQLRSLQQFRAASGNHHQKMASFSFPNMLPNMMAANMMGLGLPAVNMIQQQQQQFQSQLQQQPQRKSLFAPYLPQASLPPLLAAGKLVVGILRVNKRNRSDAYVATEVLDSDIYICGSKDRNRALEGDIVAVELLDVDEVWGTKKEKEEKKRKKEENAAYDIKGGRKDDKKKDDVEVEGQGMMLFDDEEWVFPLVIWLVGEKLIDFECLGSPMKSNLNSQATSLLLSSACPASSSLVLLDSSAHLLLRPRRNKRPSALRVREIAGRTPVVPKLSAPRSSGSSLPISVFRSSPSQLNRLPLISSKTRTRM